VRPSQACEVEPGRRFACLLVMRGEAAKALRPFEVTRNFCDAAPRGLSLAAEEDVLDSWYQSGTAPRSGSRRGDLTGDVGAVTLGRGEPLHEAALSG
jgi:hypothetical protein